MSASKFNGTYDNQKGQCREWWLDGMMIYWQSAKLIADMGRTEFGRFPDLPKQDNEARG